MSLLHSLFEIGHSGHRQIRSMEGVRGLAVFMVFLVHYTTLVEPWLASGTASQAWVASVRGMGNAGVDLFFVLSGYLIYGMLIVKPRSLISYARRRINRIYPAFLCVLVIYLVLSWLFPLENKIPTDGVLSAATYILLNLLLLPGLFRIEPIITVAWSLSYEMFYYLVIPVVIGLLRLRAWPRSARMAAVLSVAVLSIAYAYQFSASHLRLVMFLAGILLFETLESRRFPSVGPLGLVALVAGMVLIDQLAFGPSRFVVLFICFFMLCYSSFRSEGLTNRLFCWTPLRWLGNMSYSYYLIHGLALKAAFLVLAHVTEPTGSWGAAGCWGLLPAMFAITLVPATLLFALVEKPFSIAGASPKPSVTPAAPADARQGS